MSSTLSILVITANVNIDDYLGYTYYVVNASTGPIVITLPNIVSDGMHFFFKRNDRGTNQIKLVGQNNQLINGSSSINLTADSAVNCVSLNNSWHAPYVFAPTLNMSPPIPFMGGTATLTNGLATVSSNIVMSNTLIFLTAQSVNGTQGILSVGTIVPNTSFTIQSSEATDQSTVAWMLVNPSG